MAACVLYYRTPRSAGGDAELASVHATLADASLDLGGTFYLPYRHHYSDEQLDRAYPRLGTFLDRKVHYDPHGIFTSLWFQRYCAPRCTFHPLPPSARVAEDEAAQDVPGGSAITGTLSLAVPLVLDRRDHSYRDLHSSPWLRRLFYDGFLERVFSVENRDTVRSAVAKAMLRTRGMDDRAVYAALVDALATARSNGLVLLWRSVTQLRQQKRELTRQAASLLGRSSRLGLLQDYACIGDHGKTVLPFRDALRIRGHVYIVHDSHDASMAAVLERGAQQPVGRPVLIDYSAPSRIPLADTCVDLVTMHQGLHHLPQDQLIPFLREVIRILRPGGAFLVREHDARPALLPLLDLAHSVFNAVTGVSLADEAVEVRAFRPISDWRRIVCSAGFVNSMVYEVERGDPTEDEMMCFLKPGQLSDPAEETAPPDGPGCDAAASSGAGRARDPAQRALPPPSTSPDIHSRHAPLLSREFVRTVDAALDQAPGAVLELMRAAVRALVEFLQGLRPGLESVMHGWTTGRRLMVETLLTGTVDPLLGMLRRLQPYLEDVNLRSGKLELLPPELFLAVNALHAKVVRGEATAAERMAVAMIADLKAALLPPDKGHAARGTDGEPSAAGVETDAAGVETKAAEAAPTTTDGASAAVVADVSGAERLRAMSYQFDRLLEALPVLRSGDMRALEESTGLGKRALSVLVARVGAGPWSGSQVARALAPFVDRRSWLEMSAAMDDIVSDPEANQLSFANVLQHGSPWHRFVLGLLGGPAIRPAPGAVLLARALGLGDVVDMWRVAQRLRSVQAHVGGGTADTGPTDAAPSPGSADPVLSPAARAMLVAAVRLAHSHSSGCGGEVPAAAGAHSARRLESTVVPLVGSLRTLGLIDPVGGGPKAEYTWYKLPEWLQVEMVQIFGAYMEHTPWYRFPFMQMLRVYFATVAREFAVVAAHHGVAKAATSRAFITDAVPGLVMAFLLSQLQLLALPLHMALGDEYDAAAVASQAETLLVTHPPEAFIPWRDLHSAVVARTIVPGLTELRVPSLKPFSHCLLALARGVPDAALLVSVSGHVRLQLRVAVERPSLADRIALIPGCEVKFSFTLPTDGTQGQPRQQLALEVVATATFGCIRELDGMGVEIVQAYDFW